MKKDKKYYTELVEELGKKIVKEKNMIGTYFEGKLKKEYGNADISWSTNDNKIQIGVFIRRKD